MLTRENEGSKKSVRKVVQDFVHQQYVFLVGTGFPGMNPYVKNI